jgi:hypothetical protein
MLTFNTRTATICCFTFAATLLTGSAASAQHARMTSNEYRSMGWCVGLMEGAGQDSGWLRTLVESPPTPFWGYWDRHAVRENEREARQVMRRASPARREKLQRVIDQECSQFRRYSPTASPTLQASAQAPDGRG